MSGYLEHVGWSWDHSFILQVAKFIPNEGCDLTFLCLNVETLQIVIKRKKGHLPMKIEREKNLLDDNVDDTFLSYLHWMMDVVQEEEDSELSNQTLEGICLFSCSWEECNEKIFSFEI